MRTIRLLGTFLKVKARMRMEYQAAFWAGTFAQLLSYAVDFLLMWVVVDRFESLAGWNSDEIIFLYAMKLFSYGIAGTYFFMPCTTLSNRIRNGTFDESLTLPMEPLLYEMLSNCSIGYIRHMALGLGIMILSIVRLGIIMTPLRIVLLIVFLLGSALLQSGCFLIFSAPNFSLVRAEKILDLFFFEISSFVQYPITIYPLFMQTVLSFILPYAFINFYPAQFILGKQDFSVFGPVMQYLAPLVGAAVFAFGIWFWNRSLRRYQSTGS